MSWLRRPQIPASTEPSKPAVILFGDSITEWSFYCDGMGFGEVLEAKLGKRAEVWNEGQAGFTSADLVPDFDRLTSRVSRQTNGPLLFTICLGANDACFRAPQDSSASRTLVSLEDFKSHLQHFVDTILTTENCTDTKVLLITPPPINVASAWGGEADWPDPEMTEEEEREAMRQARLRPGFRTYVSKFAFADAVMGLAHEYAGSDAGRDRVAGVDVWRAMVNAAMRAEGKSEAELLLPWPATVDWKEDGQCRLPGSGFPLSVEGPGWEFPRGWFTDGLHLDGKGYEVFTGAVLEVLREKWPDLLGEESS